MEEWKSSWSRDQHETAVGESVTDMEWARVVESLDEAVMYALQDWGV